MSDVDHSERTRSAGGRQHALGVAAAVATILGLIVAGASFVYDRLDNRAEPAPPAPATAQPTTPTTSTPAAPSASAAPTSSAAADPYVKKHDIARWTLPAPRSSCGRTFADLDGDIPRARVNDEDKPGDELFYWQCSPVGLQVQNGQPMGRAPRKPPATAAECATMAQQDAVSSNLEPDDLTARDDAFCVVTDEDNVAWLHLLAKEARPSSDPDLVFRLVVWHRG